MLKQKSGTCLSVMLALAVLTLMLVPPVQAEMSPIPAAPTAAPLADTHDHDHDDYIAPSPPTPLSQGIVDPDEQVQQTLTSCKVRKKNAAIIDCINVKLRWLESKAASAHEKWKRAALEAKSEPGKEPLTEAELDAAIEASRKAFDSYVEKECDLARRVAMRTSVKRGGEAFWSCKLYLTQQRTNYLVPLRMEPPAPVTPAPSAP